MDKGQVDPRHLSFKKHEVSVSETFQAFACFLSLAMGSRESGATRFSLGCLSFPSFLFTVHGSAARKQAAQGPRVLEREGTEGFWSLSQRNLGPYLGSAGMKVRGWPACREAVL